MTTQKRLKGQEISLRVMQDSRAIDTIDSVASFNDSMALEIKEEGFLGEPVNRFDEILNGYGGDFEMQLTQANWVRFQTAVADRATRRRPNLTFNVVVTEFYGNGDSNVFTYIDVHWGEQPKSVGARGDYAKVKASFKCSERKVQTNALP